MDVIIYLVAIVAFIWPLVDLFIISKNVQFFFEIEPELRVVKKIGTEPIKNIREVLAPILPKNVIFDDVEKKKRYKKSFFWIVEYVVSGFILLAMDILFLCIVVDMRNVEQMAYLIVVFVMNLIILWILKLSPIFHYFRLNHIADVIDKIAFEIMSPNGRINEFISDAGIKIIAYVVGLLSFGWYLKLYKQITSPYLENGFIYVFLALLIFHFVVTWISAKAFSLVCKKISLIKRRVKDHKYLYDVCRNTSYIVFFTFYIVTKIVQLDSGDTTYNILLVEAVGALFLLDTYFDKMKTIKEKQLDSNEKNVDEATEEKNKMENSEITENMVEKTEPLPAKGTAGVEVDNTAIKEYFEIVNTEYQNERNKKQSFESRAGLLLTLLSAICIFYFQSIKIKDIVLLFDQTLTFALLLKILSGIMIYLLFVLTFIAIINTITTKRHSNFDVKNINEGLLVEKRIDALARLILTYRDIIQQHREINESRAKWYKMALCCTFGLLISTIIYISL